MVKNMSSTFFTHIDPHVDTHSCTHTLMYTHSCTHTRTHTYIYTYTQNNQYPLHHAVSSAHADVADELIKSKALIDTSVYFFLFVITQEVGRYAKKSRFFFWNKIYL